MSLVGEFARPGWDARDMSGTLELVPVGTGKAVAKEPVPDGAVKKEWTRILLSITSH